MPTKVTATPAEEREISASGDRLTGKGLALRQLKTDAEVVEFFGYDPAEVEVVKWTCKVWEQGMKIRTADGVDVPHVSQLWSVAADMKRRVKVIQMREALADALADLRTAGVKLTRPKPVRTPKRELVGEPSLYDVHLGKLAWNPETGHGDYDVDIARSVMLEAATRCCERLASERVGKVWLPIGNDFLNSDDMAGHTAAGTPQDEDGRWQRSFQEGRRLLSEVVALFHEVAPVEVICVPGNHDRQRTFYLGEVLDATFSRTRGITVDNSPAVRKARQHGRTLVAWTHGDRIRLDKLPGLLASEWPEEWAATSRREWHIGHFHVERGRAYVDSETVGPVHIKTIPALCAPDAWHVAQGYVGGVRAAECFVWSDAGELVANFPAEFPLPPR